MAYQSEIEKLEQRYEENPKQWFAALADAYRKEGSLDLALDYVRGGLEMRPNYASGYIVLGRCLVEKNEYAAAAQAFEEVLQLDAENIIALKSLSEIAELRSDLGGAKHWLERLLEVDPMNDDARESLERLGHVQAAPPEEAPVAAEEPEAVAGEPEAVRSVEPGAAWAAEALGRPLESQRPMELGDEPAQPPDLEAAPAEEEPFRIEQLEAEQPFQEETTADDLAVEVFDIEKDEDQVVGTGPSASIEPVDLEEPPVAAFGDMADASSEPLEVEHLDVGTFDDELAWGTGDHLSQEISEEDIVEAVEHHEELAPAVEFMEGVHSVEPAEGVAEAEPETGPAVPVEPGDDFAERDTVEEPADFGALQAIPVMSEDVLGELEVESREEVEPAVEDWTAAAGDEAVPAMASDDQAADVPEEYRAETEEVPTVEQPIADPDLIEAAVTEQPTTAEATEDFVVAEQVVPDAPTETAEVTVPADVVVQEPERVSEEFGAEIDLPLILPEDVAAEEEEAAPGAEPQPVVTETMAEVYAQQGLLPEARETYERLLEKRPDDPVLRARLAELDARARSAARKKHASRYSAAETGGPPAVAFLQQVFAGEAADDFVPFEVAAEHDTTESATSALEYAFGPDTAETDDASAPGAPTVPAPDEVSLSSVFGDPGAPSLSSESDVTPGSVSPAQGGVSFDEFYGQPKEEAPDEGEEAPPSRASGGDTSEDDFKDWLEGLKG